MLGLYEDGQTKKNKRSLLFPCLGRQPFKKLTGNGQGIPWWLGHSASTAGAEERSLVGEVGSRRLQEQSEQASKNWQWTD